MLPSERARRATVDYLKILFLRKRLTQLQNNRKLCVLDFLKLRWYSHPTFSSLKTYPYFKKVSLFCRTIQDSGDKAPSCELVDPGSITDICVMEMISTSYCPYLHWDPLSFL